MKHVHLDLVGGIAGDMFIAAALDAGLCEQEQLEETLREIGLGQIHIQLERTRRGSLEGAKIEFGGWADHHEERHRPLSEIKEMIEASGLSEPVTERAIGMFHTLGRVEADIHGVPIEQVHFHECGAVDSFLDFVGAAWIIEEAGASWSVGSVPIGRGHVRTDHGDMPLPAPATNRLLEGFRTRSPSVEAELVTPTGATILKELRAESNRSDRPDGTVQASGFGVGSREVDGILNVLRMTILETEPAESTGQETVSRLVAEIDDMQAEHLSYACSSLLEAGALDVVQEPVLMKKGRQGTRIAVLCRPEDEERLANQIFEETTTFGVRSERVARYTLRREQIEVETEWGGVQVKIGYRDGDVVQVSPEYEDCAEVARSHGVSVTTVYRTVLQQEKLLKI